MNSKIKELAEQACIEFDDDCSLDNEPIYYVTQSELAKFAELIVRECIEKVEVEMDFAGDANDFNTQDTLDTLRDQIKEHFGLKYER